MFLTPQSEFGKRLFGLPATTFGKRETHVFLKEKFKVQIKSCRYPTQEFRVDCQNFKEKKTLIDWMFWFHDPVKCLSLQVK